MIQIYAIKIHVKTVVDYILINFVGILWFSDDDGDSAEDGCQKSSKMADNSNSQTFNTFSVEW